MQYPQLHRLMTFISLFFFLRYRCVDHGLSMSNAKLCLVKQFVSQVSEQIVIFFIIQSLTIAIIFDLFYYILKWLTFMNIHPKCHAYLLYYINFSQAKSHNFFKMEKLKFSLLYNICWNWPIYSTLKVQVLTNVEQQVEF